jgi:hypothetical protein
MNSTASSAQPWWIPTAVIIGCLVVTQAVPLVVLLTARVLPDVVQYPLWVGPQYVFPANSLRLPNLPAGMQPGPGIRYRLGEGPVLLVWLVAVLAFGLLARGLKPWQTLIGALAVILVMTVLMHVVIHHFGFHLELEFM